MSYEILNQLGMADLMVQKGLQKYSLHVKNKQEKKMHVNIASKSLENSGVFVQWFAVLSVQHFFFFLVEVSIHFFLINRVQSLRPPLIMSLWFDWQEQNDQETDDV